MFNTVAVVGATGAVGRIILQLLAERNFPARNFRFLASARSAGQVIDFAGRKITVEELTHDCFKGIDLVIGSTPDETAAEYFPSAIKAGCKVIDESGYWRMNPDVALVVPEINPQAALDAKGIIASPNCSTTQMVLALKPLHDAAKVRRVVVSTYQATSGAGLQGCATCIRIPVSNCHSETVNVETERPLSVEEARTLFAATPGITVVDNLELGQYPMPSNCDGSDEVFIGRIRKDISHPNCITFWCVSDNLRKGAATNAVQIAELLAKHQTAT